MSESSDVSKGPVQQTGQAAKQETRATADRAKEAAGTVAGSAVDQARTVTGEAREQARNMAEHLRERAAQEAESQTKRTADTVRQWADDLSGMAENSPSDSPVRSLVSQAADGGRRAANLLEERGMGGLVEGLESFARRRPGTFLAGAALAGFAVGRIAKAGTRAAYQGPDGSEQSQALPPAPGTPVAAGGEVMTGYAGPGYGTPPAGSAGDYGSTDASRHPEVS